MAALVAVRSRLSLATFAQSSFRAAVVALCVCPSEAAAVELLRKFRFEHERVTEVAKELLGKIKS